MSNADKKAKVLGTTGRRRGRMPLVVLAVVAVGILLLANRMLGVSGKNSAYDLSSRRYDPAIRLQQTKIVPEFRDGKVYVDLATVNEKGIVRFEIPNQPVAAAQRERLRLPARHRLRGAIRAARRGGFLLRTVQRHHFPHPGRPPGLQRLRHRMEARRPEGHSGRLPEVSA